MIHNLWARMAEIPLAGRCASPSNCVSWLRRRMRIRPRLWARRARHQRLRRLERDSDPRLWSSESNRLGKAQRSHIAFRYRTGSNRKVWHQPNPSHLRLNLIVLKSSPKGNSSESSSHKEQATSRNLNECERVMHLAPIPLFNKRCLSEFQLL